MKCPKCQKDSTKKERPVGACPQCGWAFRFDPPAPLSDFEVEHAIQTVSKGGAFRFTRAQLVAEVERVLVKRARRIYDAEADMVVAGASSYSVWAIAGALAAVGLGLRFLFDEHCGTPLVLVAVLIAISRVFRRPPAEVASELRVKALPWDPRATAIVDRYVRGDEVALLVPAARPGDQASRAPRAAAREFDLESYGFDRVVVVQGNDNVDMLVKNQFHFQHNAAVVSFSGYPSHVADLVQRQLVSGKCEAKVFLLHDADDAGRRAATDWEASPAGLATKARRVGLTPTHADRLLPRRPPPQSPDASHAPLAESTVSLAALRPEQMMTLLFNAMTAADKDMLSEAVLAADYDAPVEAAYDFG